MGEGVRAFALSPLPQNNSSSHTGTPRRRRLRWRPCRGPGVGPGCRLSANRGHSTGRMTPRRTSPQRQGDGGGGVRRSQTWGNRARASKRAYGSRILTPLPGMMPRPRQSASSGANTSASSSRARGLAGTLDRPGVDVVHAGLTLLDLAQDRFYPQQHVHGFKSRDRAGEAEFGGDEVVGRGPDDGGDVAGAEEPGNPHFAAGSRAP